MISAKLELRNGGVAAARGDAGAWLIDGGEVRDWLETLARWGIGNESDDLRLLPVPRSISDATPVAALVTGVQMTLSPVDSAGAMPYREVQVDGSARLWVPQSGYLSPLESRESAGKKAPVHGAFVARQLGQLLPSGHACVWHPSSGLVATPIESLWQIADLVVPPQSSPRRWIAPADRPNFPDKILRLSVPPVVDILEFLDDARGDIGSRQDEIETLPKLPDEPQGALGKLSSRARRGIANMLLKLTSKAPGGAARETWIDRVNGWAAGQIERTASSIMSARDRELERLMRMLENDPDEGLKYALPLNGPAGRGAADGGDSLISRMVDFSLSGIAGGRASANWNVDPEVWAKLAERYRDLARREEEMGRYRRAAYIYANLLYDLPNAAAVLEKGRLWREAAIIYRDKLSDVDSAARCFARAGDYEEAIKLFRERGRLLDAGELCRELGQTELAERCFHEAADGFLKQRQITDAALVYKERLDDIDLGLETLLGAWPGGHEAIPATQMAFEWLGAEGRHGESFDLLDRVNGSSLPHTHRGQGVVVMQSLVATYPNRELNRKAADGVRTTVAQLLPDAKPHDQRRFLELLAAVEPKDRVLSRDTSRYLSDQSPVTTPQFLGGLVQLEIKQLHHAQLPSDVEYECAVGDRHQIIIGGWRGDELVLKRYSWDEEVCDVSGAVVRHTSVDEERFVKMALYSEADLHKTRRLQVEVSQEFDTPVPKHFPQGARLDPLEVEIRSSSQLEIYPLAMTRGSQCLYYFGLEEDSMGAAIQTLFPASPRLSSCRPFQLDEDEYFLNHYVQRDRCHMLVGEKVLSVAYGDRIALYDAREPELGQLIDRLQIRSPVVSLAQSPSHTLSRIVVGHEYGVTAIHLDGKQLPQSWNELPDESPQVLMLPSGHIIAAGEYSITAFTYRAGVLREILSVKNRSGPPIALLRGEEMNQFVMVHELGEINIFELARA